MSILIITKKIWSKKNFKSFKYKNKVYDKLIKKILIRVKPKKIFFIHWSKRIPDEIYKKYECIQFHSSSLPKYRGGSPVQNQIADGIKQTKLTAFKVNKYIDSGPIYLKTKLSLTGSAKSIYERIERLSLKMIIKIIKKNIKPKKQLGIKTTFKRRNYNQSLFPKNFKEINQVYDYIRMLDAEGYPKARLEIDSFKFEFLNAKIKKKEIHGKVIIKKK